MVYQPSLDPATLTRTPRSVVAPVGSGPVRSTSGVHKGVFEKESAEQRRETPHSESPLRSGERSVHDLRLLTTEYPHPPPDH